MINQNQNVQQLAIFKVEKITKDVPEETLLFCGYADNQEEAIAYMEQVQKQIDYGMESELQGQYIVLPALYFNLTKKIKKSNPITDENGSQKGYKKTR